MKWFKKLKKENGEAIQEVKDTTKEIANFVASNIPPYIQENRNKLFDTIIKYHSKKRYQVTFNSYQS